MLKSKTKRASRRNLIASSDNESENSNSEPNSQEESRMLDSNGESEDELEKLQKLVDGKSKELVKEKQNNSKLKSTVKLLKRELRKLRDQEQAETASRSASSEEPPWEKRRLELEIRQIRKEQEQKNRHIEQLLGDCRLLESEKDALTKDVDRVTRKLGENAQQFCHVTEEYAKLQDKLKSAEDTVHELQQQNFALQLKLHELDEIRIQHEKNLEQISEAVDSTVDKCKDIVSKKDVIIEELQLKLSTLSEPGEVVTPSHSHSTLKQEILEKNEEIEKLKQQIVEASREMERSAVIFEQFQSAKTNDSPEMTILKLNRRIKKQYNEREKLTSTIKELERLLTEKDQEVCGLSSQLLKYENGEYGLSEALKQLNHCKAQISSRDKRIHSLVQQLNELENAAENTHFENMELRERLSLPPGDDLQLPMKRVTLQGQLTQVRRQLEKYRKEAIQLGVENQNLKRRLRTEDPAVPQDLLVDYQSACSEVILLRKGLEEILQSVREQDGRSDVKVESPILERLVTVLNSERLWGHYDACADLMAQLNTTQGENKVLRERIREIRDELRQFQGLVLQNGPAVGTPQLIDSLTKAAAEIPDERRCSYRDSSVQTTVTDPCPAIEDEIDSLDSKDVERQSLPTAATQTNQTIDCTAVEDSVKQYEAKLRDLDAKLVKVGAELETALRQYAEEKNRWTEILNDKENCIRDLQQQMVVYQRSLHQQEEFLERVKDELGSGPTDGSHLTVATIEAEQTKQLMEKAICVLKARLQNQEQATQRYQQLLEEARRENIATVEEHNAEVIRLQSTVMEQQRSLHRVELTQREIAASEAVNRMAVRYMEEEVSTAQQRHEELLRSQQQLQAAQSQVSKLKQAVDILTREKAIIRESLESEYNLVSEQLRKDLEAAQCQCKDLSEQVTRLRRDLLQERQDKQRNKLLSVLVTKLKDELEKKEHQMSTLRLIAEDLQSKMGLNRPQEMNESHQTVVPTRTEESANLINKIADLELQKGDLSKLYEESALMTKTLQDEIDTLRRAEDHKSLQITKLTNEKRELGRQLAVLRTRVTKLNAEHTGAQSASADVCHLLKRIKELESQLAVFHTAEKPSEDQQAKTSAVDNWKERKRLQTLTETQKRRIKDLEHELEQTKIVLEAAKRNVNKLGAEKRSLEDKLKQRSDPDKIQKLLHENAQWQQRVEALERRLTDITREETNTDRHRVQVTVLQDRVRKQEEKIAQLELEARNFKATGTAKAILEKLHQENVALKIKAENTKILSPKIKDALNRLFVTIQNGAKGTNGENKTRVLEGTFFADLRRTLNTLQQLVDKLVSPAAHDAQ